MERFTTSAVNTDFILPCVKEGLLPTSRENVRHLFLFSSCSILQKLCHMTGFLKPLSPLHSCLYFHTTHPHKSKQRTFILSLHLGSVWKSTVNKFCITHAHKHTHVCQQDSGVGNQFLNCTKPQYHHRNHQIRFIYELLPLVPYIKFPDFIWKYSTECYCQ
jgi:hypothetical protein